jgi:hypothetical protein
LTAPESESVSCGRVGVAPQGCDAFEFMKYAMAAHWRGIATYPSGWTQSQTAVDIDFGLDDRYRAHCLGDDFSSCRVFYYGADIDSPLNRYTLVNVHNNGWGLAEIDITWSMDGNEYATRGELRHIVVSPDGSSLRFEFWRTWSGEYGPVTYDLHCTP